MGMDGCCDGEMKSRVVSLRPPSFVLERRSLAVWLVGSTSLASVGLTPARTAQTCSAPYRHDLILVRLFSLPFLLVLSACSFFLSLSLSLTSSSSHLSLSLGFGLCCSSPCPPSPLAHSSTHNYYIYPCSLTHHLLVLLPPPSRHDLSLSLLIVAASATIAVAAIPHSSFLTSALRPGSHTR
jgi:hypothetical protein